MECHEKYCKRTGTLRCSKCKKVYYCSKECQRKDWKNNNHASICKPNPPQQNPLKDCENVKEEMECHEKDCKRTGTLRCSKCKKVYYCSKECQRNDWKNNNHAIICKPNLPLQQQQNPRKDCGNVKCDKEGSLRCSRCKITNYCSKECQQGDWPSHKLDCAGKTKNQDEKRTSSREKEQKSSTSENTLLDDLMKHMADMTGIGDQSSSVSDEYLKMYPHENYHAARIASEEHCYRTEVLYEKYSQTPYMPDSDFSRPEYFVKRWGASAIADRKHLVDFIYEDGRKTGDIYERRVYPPYSPRVYQTMRNTSIANQVYEFGHTYVGIGFVDLFQVAWGSYKQSMSQKLKYYGFDASRVTTLRSKIIYGIMKHFNEGKISTSSLLQVWFSSCWDAKTSEVFTSVLQDALKDPSRYQLDQEDIPLIRIWMKTTVPVKKAKEQFSESLREIHFDDIWRMKFEEDRVKFCRYLFTGCIFVNEKDIICGNVTMFTTQEGVQKIPEELFFKAIDMQARGLTKQTKRMSNLTSLFELITSVTLQTISSFRSLVGIGQIECFLETKCVDPNDILFAEKIKRLNPYAVDWSNVPEYMRKDKFIRFARACSVDDTIHQLHFLNWVQCVFGACHVDWGGAKEKLLSYFQDCRKRFKENAEVFEQMPLQSTFFTSLPFVNYLNEINMYLSMRYRKAFEDYFLSDEKGKPLNRHQTVIVDAVLSSFFTQSHTMFRSTFTFNDDINLQQMIFCD